MAESVSYADLRGGLARSPPERSHGGEPSEGELTYENIQSSRAQDKIPRASKGATGRSCRTRRTALGVLGISLFLLTIAISLGVQCLQASRRIQQVSRQLQQASRDHAAEQHVLGEELHALRVSLEESQHLLRQAQEELNSTAVALWESQAAENQTRRQLQRQGLLLTQANHSLALLQTERESAEASLSQATSCQQIGCCPQGWKLFRWKCLWVSLTETRWENSKVACQDTSSQLLVLKKPWEAADVWDAGSPEQSNHYWIGLKKSQAGFLWVDLTHSLEIYSVRAEGGRNRKDCVDLHEGTLNWCPCYLKKRYICEKPASAWPVDGGP
ncbi:B-cell differentiation antigen CD72 [Liasis olivaceus]